MTWPETYLTARPKRVRLGLVANWQQFALLVVVNAFVGGMVGLERTVLPIIARTEFHVASSAAVLSFIAVFGLAKALTNLASGWLADRHVRRSALMAGWLIALPIPLLVLWARSWWWIVAANALLGINQGLAWSMTVIMKIDLVGPKRRGLAMGLNEFAGYLAVAGAGVLSGVAASHVGLRPGTAIPGLVIALSGLFLSWFVRDTGDHVRFEVANHSNVGSTNGARITTVLMRSMWRDAGMFSVSQAGLVNNLNDGLAWGVFPLLFTAAGQTLAQASMLAAIYPATWGICQLMTGPLSDSLGRKPLIVTGMLLQGIALISMATIQGFAAWSFSLVALGVGTALVYPTLIAAVGDVAHPSWRGAAVGVYRLWRDLGYVVGAVLAGVLIDAIGAPATISLIGILTAASGLAFGLRYSEARRAAPLAAAGSATGVRS